MGWEQLIGAIIGLMGGALTGGSKDAAPLTADQVEMQNLMKQMLKSQYGEYNYNAPLRQHITQTADWLLPKQSRMTGGETTEYSPGLNSTTKGTPTPIRPTPKPNPDPSSPDPAPDPDPDPTRPMPDSGLPRSSDPPGAPSMSGMDMLAKYLAKFGARG